MAHKQKIKRRVIVVGGGAAGMMAAISAAEIGAKVTLVEHKERIGKKLLSTGNGKCNFTNAYQSPDCYLSENDGFAWNIVRQFDQNAVCAFFQELGVYPKERNGYYYPYSGQASSVLDALRMELARLDVEIMTGMECTDIFWTKKEICVNLSANASFNSSLPENKQFKNKQFENKPFKRELYGDSVILAAGSKAAAVTGSDGSGYQLAEKLGHRIIPPLPALVQLKCAEHFYKGIAGVRVQGTVSLFMAEKQRNFKERREYMEQREPKKQGERFLASDTGEIQLTAYGISGIPVFQVSRYAAKALHAGKHVTAKLDFMPEFTINELMDFFLQRVTLRPQKRAEAFLTGMFPSKLNALWLRLCGIDKEKPVGDLTQEELLSLTHRIKQFETQVIATNSYEQAQVCCGGVDTREVKPDTLESKIVPGVYFAGELLDVDGPCGGYNLQWAWSSGYVAGREAANASHQPVEN